MTPTQAIYLINIHEFGSVNKAAMYLGVSQPNISQRMYELESQLRVSIFDRKGTRGLFKLTDTGLKVLCCARRIIKELDSLYSDIDSIGL